MKQRPFSKSIKDMKKNIKINDKDKNNNKNRKGNKNNNGAPDQPEQSKYAENKIREKKLKEWEHRNKIQR